MPDIQNYASYTGRMSKSLLDKAFFADKIPGAKVVIDYGCADGALISFLSDLFPNLCYIGVDRDPHMIQLAGERVGGRKNIGFLTSTEDVDVLIRRIGASPDEICVNFSSVLHEVFHYKQGMEEIPDFLASVNPKYITVRDMMYPEVYAHQLPWSVVRKVNRVLPEKQLDDFVEKFGLLNDQKNLVHLLLKYRYLDNWERECAENYFSYTHDEAIRLLDGNSKYITAYSCDYVLPWFRYYVKQDFNIDIDRELSPFSTHYQLILYRKESR